MVRSVVVVMVVVCVASSGAVADVPKLINYQGKLTDPHGRVIDGKVDITVRIYSGSLGGIALFSESHPAVLVTGGIFHILLGSRTIGGVPSTVFAGKTRYLGVAVGADAEMTPRQQLTSAPYAYVAETAQAFEVPQSIVAASVDPLLDIRNTDAGPAMRGQSDDGHAIVGISQGASSYGGYFEGSGIWGGGLQAVAQGGYGIHAEHTDPFLTCPAIRAVNSGSGGAILGDSVATQLHIAAVTGHSTGSHGVLGMSPVANGVAGYHGPQGVPSLADADAGVYGYSSDGPGGCFTSATGVALRAEGNIHATGQLTATKVTYSTPRQHYYSLPSEAFVPGSNVDYYNTYGNGGAYRLSGSGALVAPVDLPDGATVTSFKVFFEDNSASDLSVSLEYQHLDSGGYYAMARVESAGTPGYSSGVDSSIGNAVIDKRTRGYNIYAFCDSWDGIDLRVKGVLITYTINEAE